jgi:hypothetical protein
LADFVFLTSLVSIIRPCTESRVAAMAS